MILIITDSLFKLIRLMPLPKVPTAFQTAKVIFIHVFKYFSIPEDIISGRGPQYTSRVCEKFMEKLEVSMSCTLGYHPHVNRQVEQANQEVKCFLWAYFTVTKVSGLNVSIGPSRHCYVDTDI